MRHCCKTTSSIQGRDTRKGLESVASPVALRSVASYEGGKKGLPPRYAPLCARANATDDRGIEGGRIRKVLFAHVCANADMIVLSVFSRSGKNTRELVARAQVFSLLERGKENVYCAKDTIDAADKGVDGRAPASRAAYHRWRGERGEGRGGGACAVPPLCPTPVPWPDLADDSRVLRKRFFSLDLPRGRGGVRGRIDAVACCLLVG